MATSIAPENIVKQSFPVLNMTCASCAASVESMAKSAEGVVDASVNFATATLSVAYQPGLTTPLALQEAVRSVGYDLLLESEDTRQATLEALHEQQFRSLKQKTTWAVALSLPVVAIGMFFMTMPYANEIMWLFSTPVVLWLGRDFYRNAWKQAKHRKANM